MTDPVPMDQDRAPTGMQETRSHTHSVAARLTAYKAKMQWELFSSKYFVALCHSTDCEVCNAYIRHLLQGVEAGGLQFTPQNLTQALDEAWAMGMQDIHEDSQAKLHCRLDMARRGFDKQHDQYDCLRQDYDTLKVRLEKEKSCQ